MKIIILMSKIKIMKILVKLDMRKHFPSELYQKVVFLDKSHFSQCNPEPYQLEARGLQRCTNWIERNFLIF
jgi:hypothetical protein